MALNAYLKIAGNNQGQIKGSTKIKGRENLIEVIAFSHEVLSPRDPASGLATGKRQHKPLIITKELDKSSTLLMQALISNEAITTFELMFYAAKRIGAAASGAGLETNHYTIKLTNAAICDIKQAMLNNKNPELVKYAEYEEIYFVYEKIEWIWNEGGLSTVDSL